MEYGNMNDLHLFLTIVGVLVLLWCIGFTLTHYRKGYYYHD